MIFCELCKLEIDKIYGSGRFCSVKCARSFATKENRKEISNKVSAKLKNKHNKRIIVKCKICSIEFFTTKKRNKIFCSNSCRAKNVVSKETSDKLRIAQINRVKEGKHTGWKSRSKIEPSYPEKFYSSVLKNNKVEFVREFKVKNFFIDFAILSKMIALEIDGKQHLFAERKKIDVRKDICLVEEGWTVYRILWTGAKNAKPLIDKFLKFYCNHPSVG